MPFSVNDVVLYNNKQYKVIEIQGMGSYFYPGNNDPTRMTLYKLESLDDPNDVVGSVFEAEIKLSGGRRRHRKTHRRHHKTHRKTHRRHRIHRKTHRRHRRN